VKHVKVVVSSLLAWPIAIGAFAGAAQAATSHSVAGPAHARSATHPGGLCPLPSTLTGTLPDVVTRTLLDAGAITGTLPVVSTVTGAVLGVGALTGVLPGTGPKVVVPCV
jgi:hypothetical protein